MTPNMGSNGSSQGSRRTSNELAQLLSLAASQPVHCLPWTTRSSSTPSTAPFTVICTRRPEAHSIENARSASAVRRFASSVSGSSKYAAWASFSKVSWCLLEPIWPPGEGGSSPLSASARVPSKVASTSSKGGQSSVGNTIFLGCLNVRRLGSQDFKN